MSGYLAAELGQPVQVINRQGAGTLLAANYVLDRPEDGYTIFASAFSPNLSNTILGGQASYTIESFAYLNLQWFDEDLIALSKRSKYSGLAALLVAIRNKPKTVRASVVRGSAGHLMANLLLEVNGIPRDNLNLVTYNSGGQVRAAVAGGVVDFIVISARGSEGIRDYIEPLAIVSDRRNEGWDVPTLNEALDPLGLEAPVLPGSIRGFATSRNVKRVYPRRFQLLARALARVLQDKELQQPLDRAGIGRRWIGPERSKRTMTTTFAIFENYSHLSNW